MTAPAQRPSSPGSRASATLQRVAKAHMLAMNLLNKAVSEGETIPNEAILYHAQQAVEHSFQWLLSIKGFNANCYQARTHDLEYLEQVFLAASGKESLDPQFRRLIQLRPFGDRYRYDDGSAEIQQHNLKPQEIIKLVDDFFSYLGEEEKSSWPSIHPRDVAAKLEKNRITPSGSGRGNNPKYMWQRAQADVKILRILDREPGEDGKEGEGRELDVIRGFYAQQALEKMMKVPLYSLHIRLNETHDLREAAVGLRDSNKRFRTPIQLPPGSLNLDELTCFATKYRYSPGFFPLRRVDGAALATQIELYSSRLEPRIEHLLNAPTPRPIRIPPAPPIITSAQAYRPDVMSRGSAPQPRSYI